LVRQGRRRDAGPPHRRPTSWRYQAAIHDYRRVGDPLADPGDALPSTAERDRFLGKCQHSSWFFLPWHRMYLRCFEEIVSSTIASLGGPADWALPYWNYSDAGNPDARRLPPAFRDPQTPDGAPNPLRVEVRNSGCNDGEIIADEFDVDLGDCLREASFSAQAAGGTPGFGGPRTAFNHGGGPAGTLERVPHGSMHVQVGGWMGAFNTAGLDPLFWLHHANIDRLWEVWRGRDPVHANPAEQAWLSLAFDFHLSTGQVASWQPAQMVDATGPLLGYRYEEVSDPLEEMVIVEESARRRRMDRRTPEMVGATEAPVALARQATTAQVSLTSPTGPALESLESAEEPARMYLNIENITGAGGASSYEVYVNLPPGSEPRQHRELLAGILPMFGLAEATRPDRDHPGSGLHYALEISDLARRLQERNAWDPNSLQVTFVPRRATIATESAEEAPVAPVTVGRVSLYLG
jgi:tyrosinase